MPDSERDGNCIAGRKYKEGELLIKFKPSISADLRKKVHERRGASEIKSIPLAGGTLSRVHLRQGMSVEEAIASFSADDSVEYAEPNYGVTAGALPDDPRFSQLWGLHNTGQSGGTVDADIDAPEAWDITTGDRSVVVAVIDTGVDLHHVDLAQNAWTNEAELNGASGIDDDGNGYIDDVHALDVLHKGEDDVVPGEHGTHVAGIIGAVGNNGLGIAGVAWKVSILPCTFMDAAGNGYVDGAVECLEYVRALKERGVNIVATNNSWGTTGYSQALYDAINAQRGILFITGAGNRSVDNDAAVPHFPAKFYLPNIVAVAATDDSDALAWFSNFGRRSVAVAAPGEDILSTLPGDTYGTSSGTSSSAPYVAGIAALLKAQDPDRDWRAVRNLILSGGDAVESLQKKTITGRRANARGSLTCLDRPVFSALKFPSTATVGTPATISALSINCGAPAGPVTMKTLFSGEVIELADDGLGADLAAGDGIFSSTWTPTVVNDVLFFSSSAGAETIAPQLTVTTRSLSFGMVGSAYSRTLTAAGGVPPYAWSITSGALPGGLTLNGSTGEISGTPAAAGTFNFTVLAADAKASSASASLSLTVYETLTITTSALAPGAVGTAYTQTMRASGGLSPYTWSAAGLPAGLSLNASTGVISGTSSAPGVFEVTARVTDANGTAVTKTLSLSLLGVTTASLPFGITGNAYSHVLTASGGTSALSWAVVSGLLPAGLALNTTTGELAGVATTSGTFDFTAQVSSEDGLSAFAPFSLVIYQPLTVVTLSLPGGFVGAPYSQIVTASGGLPPYVWTISSGKLPAGLNLDGSTGEISGTPLSAASTDVTVQVRDANALTATRTVTVSVSEPLTVSTASLLAGVINKPYSQTLTASGGTPPYQWSVAAGSLPAGITLDRATGALTGTPTAAGTFDFTAQVIDAAGTTASRPLSISIAESVMNVDLVITSLTAPNSAGAGKSIAVTDTTKNNGPGEAPASVTGFYLSLDTTLDEKDIVLGRRAVPALSAGATDSASTLVAIPAGTATGSYYVIAKADADEAIYELNERYNTTARTIKIGPDLTVSALTVPAIAGAGKSLAITDTIKNIGPGDAAPSTTMFYISSDAVFDSGDALLGSREVPALATGDVSSGSTTVTVPDGIATGAYYVIARADANGTVPELVETNNNSSKALTVGPDLTVSSLTVPATGAAGKDVSLTDTTANTGMGDVPASLTGFYLSSDLKLDEGDAFLGSRTVPALAAGATNSGNASVTIPAGTATGTYYLIAKADTGNSIPEISESNNTVSRTIKVGPDLTVSALTVPATAGAGKGITVTDTTKNNGPGDAAASETGFYLSLDATLDEKDVVLGRRAVPALAAGATDSGSATVTIPAGTATGTYYFIAKADATDAISELDEKYNTTARTIKVGPDLTVSALTVPATAGAGKGITVTDTTKNNGPGDAAASETGFYLSTDSTLDSGDALLGSRAVPALAAGATDSGSATVTIPAGTATGTYYLIAKADATDAISELDEKYNTTARTIKVGPDLTVSALTVPATAGAGKGITVTDTTKNNGPGDAPASETGFYLSTDLTLDSGDVLLGSREVPALVEGATDTGSASVTVPAGTATGTYYVIAKADADGALTELSETNNTTAKVMKLGPDLIVSSMTVPSSVAAGKGMTITETTKNIGSGDAPASETSYYLSVDGVLDNGDVALGTRSIPESPAGAVSEGAVVVTVPAGTPAGSYSIIAKADSGDVVQETSETNNTYRRIITVNQ
jgi:subtilase family serine protease